MSFEDPESWELCGVAYTATRQQANEIARRVFETKEWEHYSQIKDRIFYGDFDANSEPGRLLTEAHPRAFRAAFNVTLKIVKAVLDNND